jgi:hypothetical protein
MMSPLCTRWRRGPYAATAFVPTPSGSSTQNVEPESGPVRERTPVEQDVRRVDRRVEGDGTHTQSTTAALNDLPHQGKTEAGTLASLLPPLFRLVERSCTRNAISKRYTKSP